MDSHLQENGQGSRYSRFLTLFQVVVKESVWNISESSEICQVVSHFNICELGNRGSNSGSCYYKIVFFEWLSKIVRLEGLNLQLGYYFREIWQPTISSMRLVLSLWVLISLYSF